MRKRYIYWSSVAVLGCVALSTNASASGKIIIEPKIQIAVQNDSNYWKAENDEVSVNTYSAKPGLIFGYETAKSSIDLDATIDFYSYDDLDTPPPGVRDASDDDFVGFSGILAAQTQITDRLNLGIEDSLYRTRDIAQSDPLSNSITRDEYTINTFEPNAYYDFGNKFAVRTAYRNNYIDYIDEGEDSLENRGVFDLEYNLNRSSVVFLEYQIWNRDYDLDTSDYDSNQITLNYAKQFNYFGVLAGAGYHKRTFDETRFDDLDLFSWSVVIQGQNPQAPEENPRSHMELTLKQDMNDDGTGDEYFTATVVGLEAGYMFMHKLDTTLNFVYQNSDYEDIIDNREDDTFTVSGKVAYPVWKEYMILGLEVGFEDRDSNIDGLSYDNTFAMLTLDFHYDLGSR